jgi:hypothetical protein
VAEVSAQQIDGGGALQGGVPAQDAAGRRFFVWNDTGVQVYALGGKELYQLFYGPVMGGPGRRAPVGHGAQQIAVYQKQDQNNDVFQPVPVHSRGSFT